MSLVSIVCLVFGSCVFVLTVAGVAFNAGANLVKSHYIAEQKMREEVRP